jgi:hypothetical protein
MAQVVDVARVVVIGAMNLVFQEKGFAIQGES